MQGQTRGDAKGERIEQSGSNAGSQISDRLAPVRGRDGVLAICLRFIADSLRP
jgi:hypothetical protein